MTAHCPKIRVLDLQLLEPCGPVRALLRIQIGDYVFNHCRLVFSPSAPPTVFPPMTRWRDPGGKRRYAVLCEWPRQVRQAVTESVLSAYHQQTQGQGGQAQ